MGIKGLLFGLVLGLALVRIYSIKVLENMKDLKEHTDFGKHYPRQGLELLCWLLGWLLGEGKIDQNGKLRLNFDPKTKNYGFHMYKNFDLTLPDLSNTDLEYFSLGNLCYKSAKEQLPKSITKMFYNIPRRHPQRNIDRVLIQTHKNDPTLVDEVFITQHHEDKNLGSDYVKDLTYKIGKELLKEIAELCRHDREDSDRKRDQNDPDNEKFQKIKEKFPDIPYVHFFLYQAGYDPDKNIEESKTSNQATLNKHMLELRSSLNGQVMIEWDWIPTEMMEREMKICVYKGKDSDKPLVEYPLDGRLCGEIDTRLISSPDLELRLQPITTSDSFENYERESDHTAPKAVEVSFFTFSKLFSLLLYPVSSWYAMFMVLLSIVVILIVRSLISGVIESTPRPEPHFVRVSHGRPGF